MKIRDYFAAAAAVSPLAGGTFLLPATASTGGAPPVNRQAHDPVHVLRFISVTKATLELAKTSAAQQDTDVTKKGKVIGFDQLNLNFSPKTGAGSGHFTFDTRGGFIYGTLRLTHNGATGRLAGGTGRFRHVSGSLFARNLNKAGTRPAVTLRYRLH